MAQHLGRVGGPQSSGSGCQKSWTSIKRLFLIENKSKKSNNRMNFSIALSFTRANETFNCLVLKVVFNCHINRCKYYTCICWCYGKITFFFYFYHTKTLDVNQIHTIVCFGSNLKNCVDSKHVTNVSNNSNIPSYCLSFHAKGMKKGGVIILPQYNMGKNKEK